MARLKLALPLDRSGARLDSTAEVMTFPSARSGAALDGTAERMIFPRNFNLALIVPSRRRPASQYEFALP
jgi:hypothetical protein